MSLQGPMVVVGDEACDLVDELARAGAFPIIETSWQDAASAIAEIAPAAIIVTGPPPHQKFALALGRQRSGEPFVPVIEQVRNNAPIPSALPIAADAPIERRIARITAALRVRTLHTTVLRRARMLQDQGGAKLTIPMSDPLDDATVMVVGRGRSYPTLAIAVGERAGLVGALSIESAARMLKARDIDGIVIADGLGGGVVEVFLMALAEDSRFRDLPVAVFGRGFRVLETEGLPNFERVEGDPLRLIERFLPLVRLHAFEARLKRLLKALDTACAIDPQTCLLTVDAFRRDLARAIADAGDRGSGLSMARISFERSHDRRTSYDAARLVSRLLRRVDFACRESDGSILAVFTETDLGAAHVATRRITSELKQTMLLEPDRPALVPSVTLATLKPTDHLGSLMARVMGAPAVAAE